MHGNLVSPPPPLRAPRPVDPGAARLAFYAVALAIAGIATTLAVSSLAGLAQGGAAIGCAALARQRGFFGFTCVAGFYLGLLAGAVAFLV